MKKIWFLNIYIGTDYRGYIGVGDIIIGHDYKEAIVVKNKGRGIFVIHPFKNSNYRIVRMLKWWHIKVKFWLYEI